MERCSAILIRSIVLENRSCSNVWFFLVFRFCRLLLRDGKSPNNDRQITRRSWFLFCPESQNHQHQLARLHSPWSTCQTLLKILSLSPLPLTLNDYLQLFLPVAWCCRGPDTAASLLNWTRDGKELDRYLDLVKLSGKAI